MKFEGLLLDGAMGSLLQERSGVFAPSEQFNLTHPALVEQIHRDYIAAGADIIYTNTFGLNSLRYPEKYADMIRAAVSIARKAAKESAKPIKIALDIGPTGKIIGKGGISFDEAYAIFGEVVRAGRGVDMVVIETITDLAEMRAAILAAKDNTSAPILASMSFEKNGRSAFGCSPTCFAITATALGVDAVGINCSVGPAEMVRLLDELNAATHLPTFVKPNAGMPEIYRGKSVYNVTAEAFARNGAVLRAHGAAMLGGCCGTTPAYLSALYRAVNGTKKGDTSHTYTGQLCSAGKAVVPTHCAIIGERINPTGKRALQEALRQGDLDFAVALGPKQEEEGAQLLDVNLGLSGMDDAAMMPEVVERLCGVVNTPLVIDSSNPRTIELGLKYHVGRAMVNSVNGEDSVLDAVLPIVKRYGAAVIGLAMDKRGIPDTVEGRVEIARKIYQRATACGIAPEDIYIDCLTMAEGAQRGSAMLTLNALEEVKQLGCRTVLGISNISYGMPMREDLNATFLALAAQRGLDACIVNPLYRGLQASQKAIDYLKGIINADDYIAYAARAKVEPSVDSERIDLATAVRRGDSGHVRTTVEAMLSEGQDAGAALIQALNMVGQLYEEGRYFLPQLITASDAAKVGFDLLYARTGNARQDKGTLVLATVRGDVHDIGKNIVKAVVTNYGYRVIDLGKDVHEQVILDAISRHQPCVLGLSALMTTTAVNMAEIAHTVRQIYPDLPILVGGAVLTPQFAQDMGCTYCRDAAATVRELETIFAPKA